MPHIWLRIHSLLEKNARFLTFRARTSMVLNIVKGPENVKKVTILKKCQDISRNLKKSQEISMNLKTFLYII